MRPIYSIEEIASRVNPIARAYGVERVALFGSYARGEAKPGSDIDLHIDRGEINGYFKLAGFLRELEEQFNIPIDLLTTCALSDEFLQDIQKEEVVLYEH